MTAQAQIPDTAAQPARPFLERVRLRARRRALWLRVLWSDDAGAAVQGLAISPAEVDRLLAGGEQIAHAEMAFYERDEAARQLSGAIQAADRAADGDDAWQRLRAEFGLT